MASGFHLILTTYLILETSLRFLSTPLALGPTYAMLFDLDKTKKGNIVVNDFVKNAYLNGMMVHPYTVRADALPEYASNVDGSFKAILIDADADGVFTTSQI